MGQSRGCERAEIRKPPEERPDQQVRANEDPRGREGVSEGSCVTLDSRNGQAVMDLLRELHKGGSTIVMVTHDPNYAKLATRSVTLFDGRIVEESQQHAEGA